VTNELRVHPWKNRGVRKQAATPDNEKLKRDVLLTLRQDPRVNALEIEVTAGLGHITLDGTVNSHWEIRKAEEDARNVVGVANVTNNLVATVDNREDWLSWRTSLLAS